jgi:hypothetical protein
MAIDPLKWVFQAIDMVSGPAKKMGFSLGTVKAALGAAGGAMKATGGGVADFAKTMWKVDTAIVAAAGKLVDLGKQALDGAAYVLQAKEFKVNTLGALEVLEGSAKAADDALGYIRALANKGGLPTEEVSKFYQQLRTAGFSAVAARNLLAGGADLSSWGKGGPEALAKVTELFEKIKNTGKAEAAELGKLIPLDKLKANFAAAKNMGATEFKAFIETVKGDDLLDAIMATVNKMGGGGQLGAKAIEKAGGSVSSQITILKNQWQDLLSDTANQEGVLSVLKKINGLLDGNSESGKKLRQLLGDAFTTINTVIEKIAASGAIEKGFGAILAVGTTIANVIGKVWPYISALLGPAWEGLKSVLGPIITKLGEFLNGGGGANPKTLQMVSDLGKVLGTIAGVIATVVIAGNALTLTIFAGVAYALAWVGSLVMKVVNGFGAFKAAVVGGVVSAWASIKSFGEGVYSVLRVVFGYLFFLPILVATSLAKLASALWDAIGPTLTGVWNTLVGFGKGVYEWFSNVFKSVADAIKGAVDKVAEVGTAIVDGLWNALKSGWKTLIENVKGLAALLPDVVKQVLGIKSPSRVFMALGMQTAEGFSLGYEKEAANTNDVIESAMAPPAAPGAVRASGRAGGANVNITIVIQSTGDAKADAVAIGEELRPVLTDLFDRVEVAA